MHLPELVSDLAVILLPGGVITVIFKKLNLPLVLGYILAGFLIGPYMPLFFSLADIEAVSTWSEIGIIILMFCLGLEFNLHKLASVGGTAIITALVEVCWLSASPWDSSWAGVRWTVCSWAVCCPCRPPPSSLRPLTS